MAPTRLRAIGQAVGARTRYVFGKGGKLGRYLKETRAKDGVRYTVLPVPFRSTQEFQVAKKGFDAMLAGRCAQI